jgi:hypothetical protein
VEAEAFWQLIDSSRGEDLESGYRLLVSQLSQLPVNEIHEFNLRWHEAHRQAYGHDLWGAAYLINGGASDDGFEYFRDWLILQGSTVFERASPIRTHSPTWSVAARNTSSSVTPR